MNVIQTIAANNYSATPEQVEALAREVSKGETAASTYLRILLAGAQATLGTAEGRKPPKEVQLKAVDDIHAHFYPAVQKGVGADDMSSAERHSKCTYARTSASELRGFIDRGGDIRKLVVAEVTKKKLRKYGRAVPTGTRAERTLQRASDSIAAASERVAQLDPKLARERLEIAIEVLQKALDSLPGRKTRAMGRVRRTHTPHPATARVSGQALNG